MSTRRSRESPRAEENYPPAAWEGDESRIPRKRKGTGDRGNRMWRFGGVAGSDPADRRGERGETGLPLSISVLISRRPSASSRGPVVQWRSHDGLPRYVSFEASPSRSPLRERIIVVSGFPRCRLASTGQPRRVRHTCNRERGVPASWTISSIAANFQNGGGKGRGR